MVRPLFFTVFLAAAAAAAAGLTAQSVVDLRPWQTQIKNQAGQGSCICFAGTAALEAACNRAGYGRLNLAEEFCMYMGKVMWLTTEVQFNGATRPMHRMGPNRTENQIGGTGGGNGAEVLRMIQGGLRLPEERYMRYRSNGHNLLFPWNSPFFQNQLNASAWSLDSSRVTRSALVAPRYFGIRSFLTLNNARSPAEVESVLRSGREVVWDFTVGGNLGVSPWRVSTNAGTGAHSMLIVGYDRPRRQFICKNSWGGGWTFISYAYLATYGLTGAYITAVEPPRAWPELAFFGRWDLSVDGRAGILDIYHLPGIHQWRLGRSVDRRIGTFRDHNGQVYRVNGAVRGDYLTLWWKPTLPSMRFDEVTGGAHRARTVRLRMIDAQNGVMAGETRDFRASSYPSRRPAYARKSSRTFLRDGILRTATVGRRRGTDAMLGTWRLQSSSLRGNLTVLRRDDTALASWARPTYAGYRARFVPKTGRTRTARVYVRRSDPGEVRVEFIADSGTVRFDGREQRFRRGVCAGFGRVNGREETFVLHLIGGTSGITATTASLGAGCGGSFFPLRLSAAQRPLAGSRVRFDVQGAAFRGLVSFLFAPQRHERGFDDPTSPCPFYVSGYHAVFAMADGVGRASCTYRVPTQVGSELFAQAAALMGSNTRATNALEMTIGNR